MLSPNDCLSLNDSELGLIVVAHKKLLVLLGLIGVAHCLAEIKKTDVVLD